MGFKIFEKKTLIKVETIFSARNKESTKTEKLENCRTWKSEKKFQDGIFLIPSSKSYSKLIK